MVDYNSFSISKRNDKRIVEFCKKHSRKAVAYLDGSKEDIVNKIDICIEFKDGKCYNIDSKYTHTYKDGHMWFEAEKHALGSTSKCDYLLYCMRDTNFKTCWLIRREALCNLTNDDRKAYIVNKDKLKDFRLSELNANDYKIIDFSKIGLE